MTSTAVRTGLLLALAASLAAGQKAGAVWEIDTESSQLVVHVAAAGLLSPLLHDHHLVPERWSGTVRFDPADPERVDVTLTFDADSLRNEQAALSPDDRRTVDEQIRSPAVLHVGEYPEIRFTANRLDLSDRTTDADGGRLDGRLQGTLELRGERRTLTVPVQARWWQDRLRVTGSASFEQSAFGIEPYSRYAGTVAVRDEVTLEFAIDAVPR